MIHDIGVAAAVGSVERNAVVHGETTELLLAGEWSFRPILSLWTCPTGWLFSSLVSHGEACDCSIMCSADLALCLAAEGEHRDRHLGLASGLTGDRAAALGVAEGWNR